MKNISFVIALVASLNLTSCYVGVEGGHHHRRAARLEIHTLNNANQKDSLQAASSGTTARKDSLQTPVKSGTEK